jgi:hypothetical protein
MRYRYLLLVAMTATALLAACDDEVLFDDDRRDVDGSGTVVTENRDVAEFEQVTLAGEGRVIITTGAAASLSIETDDNLMQHIETAVSNRELNIKTESGVDIDPTDSVIYRITAPAISGIRLLGAGDIDLDSASGGDFEIELLGAGAIDIASLMAESLKVTIAGVGSVTVRGGVATQEVDIPGAGSYEGRSLQSRSAFVTTSGAGSAEVWATETLEATVTGVGSIDYYGSPTVTESVTGIGSINARGEP